MRFWLTGALLLAVAALAAARYMDSHRWIDALFFVGGFAGLAVAMTIGLVCRRLLGTWKPTAALILALSAALARSTLTAQLALDPSARHTIRFWSMFLACATVVWGMVALLWGTLEVSDTLKGERPLKRKWGTLALCVISISLALYSVAPVSYMLGLTINHWTILGLFGLSCVTWAAGILYRRLARSDMDT